MQMLHDLKALAATLSLETGLGFKASSRTAPDGHHIISLIPDDHDPAHTFAIEVVVGWRRLSLTFVPGKFAGPLLQAMSEADTSGRAVFAAVLQECERLGAKIVIAPNGKKHQFDDEALWAAAWRRLSFDMSKGNLELGTDEGIAEFDIIQQWVSRFTAAVVALLPLEQHETDELAGYPEGAVEKVEVNRYERDRRNRAAALAIHGHACSVCEMEFGRTYGPVADGYIEVHHVVPVSQLGPDYLIDPKQDLVPLCSNCHAVAHRRSPPLTVHEIKRLLRHTNYNPANHCDAG